ncbi:hypothetical protein [Krasilnikovia sp. MM14-A1259]|uniref:hypothetical protein n=1 Tax=Krasilnikovia sp. MM14-A1259 TaxID=3373539 RepID=UPI0037FAEC4E
MTQPDLSIDTDGVRSHARMVDQVADMVDEARAAAGFLDLHDEVYGEWPGKLIVPLLNIPQDYASRELRNGTDATMHLADVIRSVANSVDITDTDAAQRIRAAGS